MTVDGEAGRRYRKETLTYIRRGLGGRRIKKYRYVNSRSSNGLQLADLAAGAMHRYYAGRGGDDFLRAIREKIVVVGRV